MTEDEIRVLRKRRMQALFMRHALDATLACARRDEFPEIEAALRGHVHVAEAEHQRCIAALKAAGQDLDAPLVRMGAEA